MIVKSLLILNVLFHLSFACSAADQTAKVDRIGVIHLGGVLGTVIEGLRAGLKESGLQDGKQFVLEIHDIKGDAKAAESIAQKFERDKFRLIFTNTAPVTTGALQATKSIPIVFAVGTDPVAQGFVQSFAKPGGRLTGIQYLARDLTGKRLEILKEILPKLRTVITFYDPANATSLEGAKLGRDEAQRRGLKFIERTTKSVDELNAALDGVKPGEFDAYFYVGDPMIASQAERIVAVARAKRLPTMFHDQALVTGGGLASYGQNYFEVGRRSAKYVRQVLEGAAPADLRVETIEDVELAFNLATAKQLGITIPPQVLARAQKVIK